MTFLDAATRIALRLAAEAQWQGAACTWFVQISDPTPGRRRTRPRPAGGDLYQGTAGIAWFLGECLALAPGEEGELRRAAEGALRHALAAGHALAPTSFGFHSGRVGIARVAARLAQVLARPDLLDEAWRLLAPLEGREGEDQGLDVIAGAAGAIPALLELAALLEREEPAAMARRLGDHLVARAVRQPSGWSWATLRGSAVRHLHGLAHGAAGCGLALLEVAAATGDGRYRFAAEMAFLYERSSYDPRAGNWPDLRNVPLGEMLRQGRVEELRGAARAGRLPAWRHRFMTAWCHGAPGIGLSRLRAFELTGQERYREEAEAALPATLDSLNELDELAEARPAAETAAATSPNYSLCHGVFGNAELALEAAAVLERPRLRRQAEAVAKAAWEQYEAAGRAWPCGTFDAARDPSLLLGEAGIGLFFLRLAAPEVPSPLLLRPPPSSAPPQKGRFEEMARRSLERVFSLALVSFERLEGVELGWRAPEAAGPLTSTPASAVRETLVRRLESLPPPRRRLLADACRLELCRFAVAEEPGDLTAEYLAQMIRPPWPELEPARCRFRLAAGARLLTLEHDWPAWMAAGKTAAPAAEEVRFLLLRRDQQVRPFRLGLFAASLLDAAAAAGEAGVSVAECVRAVAAALEAPPPEVLVSLQAQVLAQVEELYRAGFLDLVSGWKDEPVA